MSKPITTKEAIAQVATTSAEDSEIGELIAEVIDRVAVHHSLSLLDVELRQPDEETHRQRAGEKMTQAQGESGATLRSGCIQ